MTEWKQQLQSALFELRDEEYKQFQSRLIPGIDPDSVLGIRIPVLRKFAAGFQKTPEAELFLQQLPHQYYDENNLHAMLINQMKEPAVFEALDRFLPYVDNWATCDLLSPVAFRHYPDGLEKAVERWISSDLTYTIRFGIGVYLRFYLDDRFSAEHLKRVKEIQSSEYYVQMMVAWYFATALAKQYDEAVIYLENGSLDIWTHNKTIQKAIESLRITPEKKAYLRSLKRKEEVSSSQ